MHAVAEASIKPRSSDGTASTGNQIPLREVIKVNWAHFSN